MRWIAGFVVAVAALGAAVYRVALWMPGASRPPGCAPLEVDEAKLEEALRIHVNVLSVQIGPRSPDRPRACGAAGTYVQQALAMSQWPTRTETVGPEPAFRNVVAERTGTELPGELVVVGAHYDTVERSPGADDNASGVAGVIELARLLADKPLRRSVRLIAFANEELPLGDTDKAGSRIAAAASRAQGESIVAMLSLEGLGVYDDAPGSQRHPWPLGAFFPDRGDFLAWIGDLRSRALLHRAIAVFRASGRLDSEGLAAPARWFPDIRRSDHSAYWDQGYPALLVTDTSEFRNPRYHGLDDRAEHLDYSRMTAAVAGLAEVIACLASAEH
jgi:hypothetical protein